jgi:hypothetical protein
MSKAIGDSLEHQGIQEEQILQDKKCRTIGGCITEGSATIPVAHVRKSPYVTDSHRTANGCKNEC